MLGSVAAATGGPLTPIACCHTARTAYRSRTPPLAAQRHGGGGRHRGSDNGGVTNGTADGRPTLLQREGGVGDEEDSAAIHDDVAPSCAPKPRPDGTSGTTTERSEAAASRRPAPALSRAAAVASRRQTRRFGRGGSEPQRRHQRWRPPLSSSSPGSGQPPGSAAEITATYGHMAAPSQRGRASRIFADTDSGSSTGQRTGDTQPSTPRLPPPPHHPPRAANRNFVGSNANGEREPRTRRRRRPRRPPGAAKETRDSQ